MAAMASGRSYQELLKENPVVMETLTPEELDACFTLDYYFKNVDHIYRRNGLID